MANFVSSSSGQSVVQRWSRSSLGRSLHDREFGASQKPSRSLRSVYGHSDWINELDIVNELSGHTGCVNALSWSKTGRLLASGSDDKHVNIYRYQPEDASTQFSLATTVATGHTANIFSIKFMPGSNDRTLVSVAGDNEVRIFDLEHDGASGAPSTAADVAAHARRRRGILYDGVRFLTDGSTNCRVYRSHGERVKRIVTESSPHLFLTCSEDGEVRQWDLRQPSSAYPAPRLGRRWESDSDSVPPPLISYKRYGLDLNTISCSPSQPHYIALGGAHLHCLLHDRRMTGRDRSLEQGNPGSLATQSEGGMESMGQATRCVRKFAPNGQQRMRSTDSGHITACKISDANPNEMVVSWSGDSIYSFDLIKTPETSRDANDRPKTMVSDSKSNRLKQDVQRKRKRPGKMSSTSSHDGDKRAESRQKTEEPQTPNLESHEMALRVQYGNGQTEDIPIQPPSAGSQQAADWTGVFRNNYQRIADDLARRTFRLRSALLDPGRPRPSSSKDIIGHGSSFTTVLGFCASTLPEMRRIHAAWQYPVDPSLHEITVQRRLRADRETCIRFVQAAGVAARVLGGRLQSAASDNSSIALFDKVAVSSTEGPDLSPREQFHVDFLRAIFLWLDSGVGALLAGFSFDSAPSGKVRRFPVPTDADIEAIDEVLIPYLLGLAGNRPIINIETSRFEVDENRILFSSEHEAIRRFADALKKPFADLSSAEGGSSLDESVQDRTAALRYWGLKVARGVLKNCSEHLRFPLISQAFGGLGVPDPETVLQEQLEHQQSEEIDTSHEDASIALASVQLVNNEQPDNDASGHLTEASPIGDIMEIDGQGDPGVELSIAGVAEPLTGQSLSNSLGDHSSISELGTAVERAPDNQMDHSSSEDDAVVDDEDDDDDEDEHLVDTDDDELDEEEEDDDEQEEEDDEGVGGISRRIYRSAFKRSGFRAKVEPHVPCASHTRVYRGHCNVQTVKDVNFFGLNDEYVVSGSDDGNLFIWDRKTTRLVNILEGDGEVVNVIQGHPYEPLLAVSGIDDTIKIFSPDARARMAARLGSGVEAADASTFSSINWPSRAAGRRIRRRTSNAATSVLDSEGEGTGTEHDSQRTEEDEEFVASNGLPSRKRLHLEYQITSQNDSRRQNGNQEAYISIEDILAMFFRRAG